ncbi:MAG: hypothetical protein BWX79_02852 [Alphaproteobacteria bacterium ADurb.Bin100]|nr:MAG: hypothetical protein BWX79_02852 [Alphaproteobacteria bacterium ADurb.Bin100]
MGCRCSAANGAWRKARRSPWTKSSLTCRSAPVPTASARSASGGTSPTNGTRTTGRKISTCAEASSTLTASPTRSTRTTRRNSRPSRRASSITSRPSSRGSGRVPTAASSSIQANSSRRSSSMAMRATSRVSSSIRGGTSSRIPACARPLGWPWISNGSTDNCSTTPTHGSGATSSPATSRPPASPVRTNWRCSNPCGPSCRPRSSRRTSRSRPSPASTQLQGARCATTCAVPARCWPRRAGPIETARFEMPRAKRSPSNSWTTPARWVAS